MTREMVIRAFGWKGVAAVVLLVTALAGALAAWQFAGDDAGGVASWRTATVSESAVLQSGGWLRSRDERVGRTLGRTVEVHLDAVLGELGDGVVLDRPALLHLLQVVVGEDPEIESKPVADVLGRVSRVRVISQGLSLVIGRRVLIHTLQHVIGAESGIEQMTVGEVLDSLADAKLTSDGVAGVLDQDAVTSLLGGALTAAQRVTPNRDPRFLWRQVLLRRYAEVVELVKRLERGDLAGADRNVLYAEAHKQLVAARKRALIPLLDGHLRLEDELAATRVGTTSRAERIVLRWEARRKAFDNPVAELLFGREEAVERYEVDRLALEADDSLSAEDKAQRLAERRHALKVELAAQGSYVSFADEARARERDAGERAGSEQGGQQ